MPLADPAVSTSIAAAKAAGVAFGRLKNVSHSLTVDAMVMATAALADAVVVTSDRSEFERLAVHFPRVVVIST